MSRKVYLKRDWQSVLHARWCLVDEVGDEVWAWSDEEVCRFADALLESFGGEVAPLRTQLRRLGAEIGKTRRGRLLGRLFGVYPPPPPNIYERLLQFAEPPPA